MLISFSKPNRGLFGIRIGPADLGNLLTSLRSIRLVDADGINPEGTWMILVAQNPECSIQISPISKQASINKYRVFSLLLSQCIGESFAQACLAHWSVQETICASCVWVQRGFKNKQAKPVFLLESPVAVGVIRPWTVNLSHLLRSDSDR
jgi:hypothetical protein